MPDSSKTEKATPKKRRDEKKRGNVFQSRDAVSAVSIFTIFAVLKFFFPYLYRFTAERLSRVFESAAVTEELTVSSVMPLLRSLVFSVFLLVLPVALASAFAAVFATGVQTGFRFSKEKIKFKFSNINPLAGFKRMFSLRSLTELVKTLIKIVVIGWVLWSRYRGVAEKFPSLMFGSTVEGAAFILQSVMDAVLSVTLVFAGLAVLDYLYQWWEYERELRMTKQEIKEEYRQTEGDPLIKSQIRQQQRKLAMRRMMQKVPTADVVIRNPTHYAVALAYDPDRHAAPVVVAKGRDELALRIVAVAERSGVPVTENRPLARALYEAAPLDAEIPEEFYAAMADILAWVYSLRKEKR